jgi:hypothetical protein
MLEERPDLLFDFWRIHTSVLDGRAERAESNTDTVAAILGDRHHDRLLQCSDSRHAGRLYWRFDGLPFTAKSARFDDLKTPRHSTADRIDYPAGDLSQRVQVERVQIDHGDVAIRYALSVNQILIAGHQNVEALSFAQLQQLTVLFARPTHVGEASDIVTCQALPQLVRQVFVE